MLYGVTWGSNKILRIDVSTGRGTVVAKKVLEGTRLNDMAFHPDGRAFILSADFRQAVLYQVNLATGRKIRRWNLTGGGFLESLLWSEDGQKLFSAADRAGYKDLCTIDTTTCTVSFVSAQHSGVEGIEGLAWFHGSGGAAGSGPPPQKPRPEPAAPRPTELVLHQNVPNPFNPTTCLEFDLPRAGEVELFVYDVTGRRVATLVQGRLEAGHHDVVWSARSERGERAASGIYFYRLRVDGEAKTRRMTLLK